MANPLVAPDQQAQWRPLFLRVLRNSSTLREAAESIGLTTATVRAAMTADPAFAELVNQANEDATELLEAEAIRRAMNGSDLLLIFMLKAKKPHIYRDKPPTEGVTQVNVKTYVGFTPDEWDKQQTPGTRPQVIDGVSKRIGTVPNQTDLGLSATPVAETTPA